jgi:AraC-like DNA-binding protein
MRALTAPDRLAFRSREPTLAHAHAQRMMADHRMTLARDTAPFLAEVHHVRLGSVRLLHFAYGAAVHIESAPLQDFATVHLPLQGRLDAAHGGARIGARPGQGVVFSPDGDVSMDWSAGLRLLVVRIERDALEERLRALLGAPLRDPLRFTAALDPRRILASIATAHGVIADCGPAGPPPLVAQELERSIITALLLSQPHTYSQALREPPPAPDTDVVEAALERAARTPGDPPALHELAAAAGVSERTLHDAFRTRFGTSPAAHVRGLRLQAARDDLLVAGADATTVARIAAEHGFAHPGRFAVAYRQRFGESPGATLRREA